MNLIILVNNQPVTTEWTDNPIRIVSRTMEASALSFCLFLFIKYPVSNFKANLLIRDGHWSFIGKPTWTDKVTFEALKS